MGKMVPKQLGGIAGVAGLFEQLAGPGGARVLAGIEQAPGRLQTVAPRAGPELADHHDLLIAGQGDGMNPVGQVGDVEIMGLAALSRLEPFATQAKQPVLHQRLVVCAVIDADP